MSDNQMSDNQISSPDPVRRDREHSGPVSLFEVVDEPEAHVFVDGKTVGGRLDPTGKFAVAKDGLAAPRPRVLLGVMISGVQK